jgi:hypothetical protein
MTEAAQSPNVHGLVELSSRDGIDIRPTLLRVMTDLYVQKPDHTEQEAKHFTELALRLIELVDADTRALIADKIGAYPNAPAAVRHRLLREQILLTTPETIAEPVAVIAELAAAPAPAPTDELSELFFQADAEERRLILLNLPYAPIAPASPVSAQARDVIHRMEAAALGRNSELFAREIARALSVSREHARRLIADPSGESIVVVSVALGMPASVLQRILLCLSPSISESVQRIYELALLHEEVEQDAALRMIAIWQASHPAEKNSAHGQATAHQPQYWNDERQRSAQIAPATPAERPQLPWAQFEQTRRESA